MLTGRREWREQTARRASGIRLVDDPTFLHHGLGAVGLRLVSAPTAWTKTWARLPIDIERSPSEAIGGVCMGNARRSEWCRCGTRRGIAQDDVRSHRTCIRNRVCPRGAGRRRSRRRSSFVTFGWLFLMLVRCVLVFVKRVGAEVAAMSLVGTI